MFQANDRRYEKMRYKRAGNSGVKLPYISLGMWQNFGSQSPYDKSREMTLGAFDLGITHFDLANNYGPTPGSAERTLGRILQEDLHSYRDELFISTKAGYTMWEGPYGDWGSGKSMLASLDQSLKRMGLDYVDLFYSHRSDPDTPLEETMGALAQAVRSGRALYVGISNYSPERTAQAVDMLDKMGIHCLLHQMRYHIFERKPEEGLYKVLEDKGVGAIPFSPLAQGLLTSRYLHGIPADSRAAGSSISLNADQVTQERVSKLHQLNNIARERGQTLAQMAISWLHRSSVTASVIVGASRLSQIRDSALAQHAAPFSDEELNMIDQISQG